MDTMAGLTTEALTELVNHVFLPPQLPQQSDSRSSGDFMRLSLAALREFSQASPTHGTIVHGAIKLLETSHAIHDLADDNISEPRLREALKARSPAFLHVRAQNAGVCRPRVEPSALLNLSLLTYPCDHRFYSPTMMMAMLSLSSSNCQLIMRQL